MSRPSLLNGIRVVDLTMGWAGPLATRHLADMGAEILKIESCRRADWWRGWEATREWAETHGAEKAVAFNTVNRHKLDITLDLEQPAGKRLCERLVEISDVVIANYSGGVLEKLGLDYDALSTIKPDIVMMSMPAFGSTGPWRNYRAYGSTIEQASGLPHLHGRPDWPPTMIHVAYGDPVAGLNAAAALLVALRHRKRTGEGQYLDLSQSECLFPLGIHGILAQSVSGEPAARNGNRSDSFAPHGTYPCRGEDEWITIQVFDDVQWAALQEIGGEALAGFGDTDDRLRRCDELDDALAAWTSVREADEVMRTLQSAGVCAGVVKGAGALVSDPQLVARNYWQMIERPYVGEIPHPSSPWREGESPYDIDAPSPTLGQHNHEVLMGLLGLSSGEIDHLLRERIIGNRPLIDEDA